MIMFYIMSLFPACTALANTLVVLKLSSVRYHGVCQAGLAVSLFEHVQQCGVIPYLLDTQYRYILRLSKIYRFNVIFMGKSNHAFLNTYTY